jgi:PmbA protein
MAKAKQKKSRTVTRKKLIATAARKKAAARKRPAAKKAVKKAAIRKAAPKKSPIKKAIGKVARIVKKLTAPAAVKTPTPKVGSAGLDKLHDLVAQARKAGADAADALFVEGTQVSVGWRMGARERLERSEGHDLGLRVFVGKRQAMVSTNDFSRNALSDLAQRAVAMARAVPEDQWCGIADRDQLATSWPSLDLVDPKEPSAEYLLDLCREAEDAARAVKGVTNSEGADAGWSRSQIAIVASNGFAGAYERGGCSLSASVIAGQDTGMERDYEWTTAVYEKDMMDAAKVGRTAGQRAVKRLDPKVPKSGKVPVVYDPRVSGGLLGHLIGAINGKAIARGTSFLKDRLGKQVFAKGLRVIDDPHRKRGLRSRPFDAEGLPTKKRNLIEDGVLTTWLLDLASAWQLKMEPTGHASRGTSGPPSPSAANLSLAPGKLSPKKLISDIKSGLYITDLIGFGVNGVTGDYSRGASGFWIENGELTYPVSGLTVAGNLKEMFLHMSPANDLVYKSGSDAPTIRIEGMTVAGQ